MSQAAEILQDIVSALRSGGDLASVTLGPAAAATTLPRVAVIYEGQDFFAPDDSAEGRWGRVRCRVILHTRCDDRPQQVARVLALTAAAGDAVLADPYRGGRCCDLPIGRATEVGRAEPVAGVTSPDVEVAFAVRCHFEMPEGV